MDKDEIADLKKKFGEAEESRRLRAHFLERLITGSLGNFQIKRHGIRIVGAVIEEPLSLEQAEFSYPLWLDYCDFKKPVSFRCCNFLKVFSIEGSSFYGAVDFAIAEIKSNLNANGAKFFNENEKANFNDLKAGDSVFFRKTEFHGSVDFGSAKVANNFEADEAKFLNKDGAVIFNATKVGGPAKFNKAEFCGHVNFSNAEIKSNLEANESRFLSEANFNGIKMGTAFFNKAEFCGPVNFSNADVKSSFEANESRFLSEANFNVIKMGPAFFKNVEFHGAVDFVAAEVKGVFEAEESKFLNEKEKVRFNGMQVASEAHFNKSEFSGPADFVLLQVKGNIEANKVKFLNKEGKANFSGIKSEYAFFNNAEFHGPVDFCSAEVKGQFHADEAQFLSKKEVANFNAIKVGQAFFRKAEFNGPTDFVAASIGEQIDLGGATFQNGAVFNYIRVGLAGSFQDMIFDGAFDLSYANFLYLYISQKESAENEKKKKEQPTQVKTLNLTGTIVKGELEVSNLTITNLKARDLQGQGESTFQDIVISRDADFQGCVFQTLNFTNVTWGKNDNHMKGEGPLLVNLNGMTYKDIHVRPKKGDDTNIEELKRLVEDSDYNIENYLQLEAYLKRSGHEEEADKIYRQGKHRQLTWSPKDICIWFFWGLLTGYGRDPWRILWICLCMVAFGMMAFDPQYLNENYLSNSQRPYEGFLPVLMVRWLREGCFWQTVWRGLRDRDFWRSASVRLGLSLDVFIPTAHPAAVDHLRRAEVPTRILVYFFFHKLAGMTLITLFAAAAITSPR